MTTYNENFFTNSSNWETKDTEKISLDIGHGCYVIEHRQDAGWWAVWNTFKNHTQSKFGIKTKITRVLGATDSFYGLVWGLVDVQNFSYLLINPRNQFVIGNYKNCVWNHTTAWTFGPLCQDVGNFNRIEIYIQNGILELQINRLQSILSNWEIQIPGDKIGFIVGHTMKVKISELTVTTQGSVHIPGSEKIKRNIVNSSYLRSIGYNPGIQILEIEFTNGEVTRYFGVPQQLYIDLMNANSHGKYFIAFIRDRFQNQLVNKKTSPKINIENESKTVTYYSDHDWHSEAYGDFDDQGKFFLWDPD